MSRLFFSQFYLTETASFVKNYKNILGILGSTIKIVNGKPMKLTFLAKES